MLPDTPPTESPTPADAAPAPEEVQAEAPELPAPVDAVLDPPADASADTSADAAPAPAAGPPDLSPAVCAARLGELFPALFGAGRALPIKLRIQADIQERAPGVFNKKSLSIFLHRHTTSTAYIRALVQAPQRFDLDGAAAGEVAEEHRVAAIAELERRRLIVEARRAAEREAQREAQRGAQRQAAAAARQAQAAQAAPDPQVMPQGDAAQAPDPWARRPPRPPRRDAMPRRDGAPQQQPAHRAREPREKPQVRDPRPPRPPMNPQLGPEQAEQAARPDPAAAPLVTYSAAELEARRERASLLRAWDSSTLTRANFCVLKRIAESELDAQLALARKEQPDRPPQPRADAGSVRPAQPTGGFRRDDRGGPPHRRGPGRPPR